MMTEKEKDTVHHPTLREEVDIGLAGESAEYAQAPRLIRTTNLKDMNPLDITASTEKSEVDGKQQQQPERGQSGVLTGARLYLVFVALMLCVFMFALDQSIVSTAIPVIVSDFNAFDQVAWIITGYFLTQCGLILLVGQVLTILKAKWMLLGAIFFFELGSLICGVAKDMDTLIGGRAIQGIGASGMFVSILAVIAVVTRVDQRAAFMASFGFVFVISSVVGPLLGGAFTDHVSWRWCFYINLPFGGFAATAVVFLLPARDPEHADAAPPDRTVLGKLRRLDWLGTGLIFCAITCLLLALAWGGNQYAWNNWRIPFLFTLGGLLVIAFGIWQWRYDKYALIPLSILKNRTVLACSGAIFFFMLAMLGGTYQLPLFYQAGRGHSPEKSGVDIIAFMLATCVAILISGGLTTKFGRYYPFLLIGPPFAAVGFGLLYTIDVNTSNAKIIGYQILAGFGIGLSFQNILVAVQAEYHDRPSLLPQATGVVSFFQLTGAALGVGIINTVQSVYLNTEIKRLAPEVDFNLVRQSVSAIYTLPADQQSAVIEAYVISITNSLIPIIVAVGLAMVIGAFIRNHNLLKKGGAASAHMA
ncbi:major facilitator superfamily transporter [Cryptococcus neoformans AD2-60a]|nr:major facilitator superfamily transporter [Cryptococcus neoformans var. grubii AD2-60a]OWZ35573.1 major facilitator superfamily transporter [Cryptococcus neoformans var. grubii AD1-83a]OWZ52389.1 major facilitator superfamily transporter [Cryptococcus neoformans var. grubii 125.91]OXC82759.1 major facilitator superfamily transporter [Cryptococcus neoformans var. grubii AD1-7a]OXG29530.1 major facilitator superfamily transporter [Cryptococcus neoformans var. grubii Bt15]OXG37554.1 major faci